MAPLPLSRASICCQLLLPWCDLAFLLPESFLVSGSFSSHITTANVRVALMTVEPSWSHRIPAFLIQTAPDPQPVLVYLKVLIP